MTIKFEEISNSSIIATTKTHLNSIASQIKSTLSSLNHRYSQLPLMGIPFAGVIFQILLENKVKEEIKQEYLSEKRISLITELLTKKNHIKKLSLIAHVVNLIFFAIVMLIFPLPGSILAMAYLCLLIKNLVNLNFNSNLISGLNTGSVLLLEEKEPVPEGKRNFTIEIIE